MVVPATHHRSHVHRHRLSLPATDVAWTTHDDVSMDLDGEPRVIDALVAAEVVGLCTISLLVLLEASTAYPSVLRLRLSMRERRGIDMGHKEPVATGVVSYLSLIHI